jgi:fructose/tagatose bisphosphate aldolase
LACITLRQLRDHAAEHGYGLPAFNINDMEQGLAIMEAAEAADSRSFSKRAGAHAPHQLRRACIHH